MRYNVIMIYPQKISQGFSLIEMLVAIAVGSILLVALTIFVGRAFNVSREQFEQVRITEEARIELDRIVDSIRNARNVDCDGDGSASEPSEHWLQAANSNYLMILTNLDDDEVAEKVAYFSENGELKKTVTQLDASCAEGGSETGILTRYLRNESAGVDLFGYYKGGSGQPVAISQPESAIGEVEVINTTLVIDVNEDQYPSAINVATATSPRGGGSGLCPSKDTKSFEIGVNPGDETTFVNTAFSECRDWCGSFQGDSGDTQYCPWMGVPVLFDSGDSVAGNKSVCICEPAVVPVGLTDGPVSCNVTSTNTVTDYTRRCWGEDLGPDPGEQAICGVGVKGVVYADMGQMNLTDVGQCGCQCP